MIKEEEIKWYRENVINKYVDEIMRNLAQEQPIKTKDATTLLQYKPNYKKCKRCGAVKHVSEFYKNPLKFKGVFDYCKACAIKRQKELRLQKITLFKKRVDSIK